MEVYFYSYTRVDLIYDGKVVQSKYLRDDTKPDIGMQEFKNICYAFYGKKFLEGKIKSNEAEFKLVELDKATPVPVGRKSFSKTLIKRKNRKHGSIKSK
jgi:hypothetical protein